MSTYFLLINGETKGRYSVSQVKAMYEAGTITADTLYWSDGLPEWKPVDHLFQQETLAPVAVPLVTKAAVQENDSTVAKVKGLIPCPTCKKSISMNADSCPFCGNPLKGSGLMGKPDSAGRVVNVLFLIIVLVAIGYWWRQQC